jgi:hypothetical protein
MVQLQATQLRVLGPIEPSIAKIGDDLFNFFSKMFRGLPESQIFKQGGFGTQASRTQRGRLENIIDAPSGSTRPIISTKGVVTTVATTGAAISVPLGFLTLTPQGGELIKTGGELGRGAIQIITPLAEGAGDIFKGLGSSPLLIGGLIILGGLFLLKK